MFFFGGESSLMYSFSIRQFFWEYIGLIFFILMIVECLALTLF